MPGEVSTRAGWPGRLTSLPRRQAASRPISASRGWGPGRAPDGQLPATAARGGRWLRKGKGVPWAPTGTGHLPVMTDRVLALLAPALEPPGAVLVDATLGRAGPRQRAAQRAPRAHPDRRGHRRRPRSRRPGTCSPRTRERVTLVHAVYDEIPAILARLGQPQRAGRPVRPRGVLAAAGRPRPRLRLLLGRAAGHADGPDRAADRRGRRQHLLRPPGWPRCCASTARSGSPAGSPTRVVRERVAGPAHLDHAAERDRPGLDPGARPGGTAATRPSAPSRRCGSR